MLSDLSDAMYHRARLSASPPAIEIIRRTLLFDVRPEAPPPPPGEFRELRGNVIRQPITAG